MSWHIRVDVKDGKASVAEQPYYPPPDGIYTINGHSDDSNESITATRYAEEHGHVLVQATGQTRKVSG